MSDARFDARRKLLKFLAGSPLFACLSPNLALGDDVDIETLRKVAGSSQISKARDALDVFNLERIAERELPPAHCSKPRRSGDGLVQPTDGTGMCSAALIIILSLSLRLAGSVSAPRQNAVYD